MEDYQPYFWLFKLIQIKVKISCSIGRSFCLFLDNKYLIYAREKEIGLILYLFYSNEVMSSIR